MIISHSNNFIFFKSIKTAGTSIEASLSYYCDSGDFCTGPSERDGDFYFIRKFNDNHYKSINNFDKANMLDRFHSHTYPNMLYDRTGSKWEKYSKITCVRNPWDLFVSYYWWCMRQRSDSSYIISQNDSKSEIRRKFRMFMLSPARFDNGIEIASQNSKNIISPIEWLSINTNNFITSDIDHFIRFENISEDIDSVFKSLNLKSRPVNKYKSNLRKTDHHYTEYYDSLTKSQISTSFKSIIEKFKYKF